MKTVLVCSLKGGTGKSTVSCALAKVLSETYPTVLIDADIDSPNVPEIMKLHKERIKVSPNKVELVHLNNLDVFSFGLITDRAVSMRGEAYLQFLVDLMSHADFKVPLKEAVVIIDCPAGASDLFRGVVEAYANSIVGAVVVTTPSTVIDAGKMISILSYFGVPVLGLVCNMSRFKCECGREYKLFGEPDEVKELAEKAKVKYYGEIPVIPQGKEDLDAIINSTDIFNEVIEDIMFADPVKSRESIKQKLQKKVPKAVKEKIIKVIVNTLARLNKKSLDKFISEGFGGNTIELLITDNEEPITQIYLKLTPQKILVLKQPKEVDLTICADLKTLIDIVEDRLSIEDAVMMGEIEIYGSGGAVRAMAFLQKLWEEMKEDVKEIVDEVK